jgi:hypothetical protein
MAKATKKPTYAQLQSHLKRVRDLNADLTNVISQMQTKYEERIADLQDSLAKERERGDTLGKIWKEDHYKHMKDLGRTDMTLKNLVHLCDMADPQSLQKIVERAVESGITRALTLIAPNPSTRKSSK